MALKIIKILQLAWSLTYVVCLAESKLVLLLINWRNKFEKGFHQSFHPFYFEHHALK